MTENAKDQDQSMEEILQSIKRIIAEEGEPPMGSDVLELTEILPDEEQQTMGNTAAADSFAALTMDEIMANGDGKFSGNAMPESAPISIPEPIVEEEVEPEPVIVPPIPAQKKKTDDSLISEATLAAAAAAMDKLREIPEENLQHVPHHSMGFRSGTTVEDLVLESLKPMLREWLEDNLTEIVEQLVAREVRKLTAR